VTSRSGLGRRFPAWAAPGGAFAAALLKLSAVPLAWRLRCALRARVRLRYRGLGASGCSSSSRARDPPIPAIIKQLIRDATPTMATMLCRQQRCPATNGVADRADVSQVAAPVKPRQSDTDTGSSQPARPHSTGPAPARLIDRHLTLDRICWTGTSTCQSFRGSAI
jgi:hypothetical protein